RRRYRCPCDQQPVGAIAGDLCIAPMRRNAVGDLALAKSDNPTGVAVVPDDINTDSGDARQIGVEAIVAAYRLSPSHCNHFKSSFWKGCRPPPAAVRTHQI